MYPFVNLINVLKWQRGGHQLILGLHDPFDPLSWTTGAQDAEAACLTRINQDLPPRLIKFFGP